MAKLELTGHHDGCGLTELCRVVVADDPSPTNGAHYHYELWRDLTAAETAEDAENDTPAATSLMVGEVFFQNGPRDVAGSIPGTLDGAVISVLIHRYQCLQAGPYPGPENAEVLTHLYEVRRLIVRRAQERAARGVLGKNER